MSGQLQLTLLGNPTVTMDGKPVSGFISSKATALVYYLAVTGRSHSREMLAGLLWGDFPDTKAKKNLRDVLSNLRKVLGGHFIITRQTVVFDQQSNYVLDVSLLMSALVRAETDGVNGMASETAVSGLREAVDLYKGAFLEGFYVSGAAAFEEWSLTERESLRRKVLQALFQLSKYYTQQGNYEQAIRYTSRLLTFEPWQEASHRQLMQLFVWSGQRNAAIAQYETCVRLLDEELGVEPEAATTTLYEQILAGEVTARLTYETTQATRPLHNLPAQLTPFVGRDDDLEQLVTQLQMPACRLLTLVGVGGMGKTRLALQVAQSFLADVESGDRFKHGIFFIPLANIDMDGFDQMGANQRAMNSLAVMIGDMLGVAFSGAETPVVQLSNYLREKEMLLVMDNFEHLLPLGAHFLVTLLQTAPRLKVLATSRERLNVRGEQIYSVTGLAFPTTSEAPMETWAAHSAVQLFLQTAQTIDPHFALNSNEKVAVTDICQLMAGLPLGVELAATWVRLLSCQEIAQEIQRGVGFLETTMNDLPERHRSLRAVFDYSWDLLTPEAQQVFQKLAVFRGGFSREAAVLVTGASLSVLQSLTDASLVRRVMLTGQIPRYQMLEVVRQYALERLEKSAELMQMTRSQHSRAYLDLLQSKRAQLRGTQQRQALREISTDIENIRAAWQWGVTHKAYEAIGEALEGLFQFYDMRSWFQEGVDVFAQAASVINGNAPLVWGKLVARQGWFTFHLGRQTAAKALLERSIDTLRPLNDPEALIFPLNYLAAVNYYLGAYEMARQLCQESLQLSNEVNDLNGQAIAYNILGQIAHRLHNHEVARDYCQRSLVIAKEIGNRWSMSYSLTNLGQAAFALENYEEAARLFEESLQIREEMGDPRGVALCLNLLAETAVSMGQLGMAEKQYQESRALFEEIGNRFGVTTALVGLGHVAQQRGVYREAKAYYDSALRRAMAIDAFPRVLDILQALVTLWHDTGQLVLSDKVKSFIRHAPVINEVPRKMLAEFVEEILTTAVVE